MKMWWQGDAALDAQMKDEFEGYLNEHLTFKEEMKGDPTSLLSYILLTDQFARNIYRNDPRAFATDEFAREVCRCSSPTRRNHPHTLTDT